MRDRINQESFALELLGEVRHVPAERAKRIAGIYAAFYLEDPFLFAWHGLACFVARQVHFALDVPDIGYSDFMAKGNLGIYRTIVGATLAFRAGQAVEGNLGAGFGKLAQARASLMGDFEGAKRLVEEAVLDLCLVEQRDILQSDYASLPQLKEDALEQIFSFRLGFDPGAPVLRFPGDRARSLEQRLDWTKREILPAWNRWRGEQAEWARADVERVRRWAGVRGDLLPRRWDR